MGQKKRKKHFAERYGTHYWTGALNGHPPKPTAGTRKKGVVATQISSKLYISFKYEHMSFNQLISIVSELGNS